jgi:signal transduction histidine kinase/integral membrane sensor domain MASE1
VTVRLLKDTSALVVLLVVYLATAKLGLGFDAASGFATLVWPPSGIALAALLLYGMRLWPAITLGAFLVNLATGAPPLVAFGMAAGNTLEAVVGAHLLLQVYQFDLTLRRARDVLALLFAACIVSTLISATVGTGSLWVGGVISGAAFASVWRTWWVGDALGDLIVAPVLLVWGQRQWLRVPRRHRAAEAAALVAAVILVSLYVFDVVVPLGSPVEFRWPFLTFPVLIWAAWRFQQRGATAAMLLVAIVATAQTILGLGPFAASRLSESLLSLQVFMSVVAITTLFLAAIITERNTAALVRDEALERVGAAERRSRFLAEASRILASGLDYEKTMTNVARLVVPTLGDNCVVDVVLVDGSIRRVAEASADPAKEELLRRLRKYPPNASRPTSPVFKVLKTGQTEYIPHFDIAALRAVGGNDEYVDIVRAIAPRSSVTVPLKSRDRIVGAITFGMAESGRSYQPEDIALAEEFAARAAVAADNATLYDESQQAIRARDVFLAVASHELRTPLTALNLQVGNLIRSLERSRTDEEASAPQPLPKVKEMEQQIARITALVETLLDVSRVGSGRIELALEELDLREVVRDAVAHFRDQATSAGCDLEVELGDGACRGRWDRLRIEQVLINLLANAVKFGAGEPVRVVLVCSPAFATLSVHDQGIGIARQDHQRIFELFHRTPTERPFGGLGLGLWIARQIVTAMGGSIDVKSALSQGAEFIVSLPRN